MAYKLAVADGNWTAAATWATVDASALVSISTGTTNLTTSDQASANFAPGAITVDGVALHLNAIANTTAMPTQTLTVTLYDATAAAAVVSLTYQCSDLPAVGSAGYHGWFFFKFDTTYLLVAGHNYNIRLKVSSTTTQPTVSFKTNGTTANWQHMLRIPGTTSAPAASDDLYICGELAVAGWTSRTVTMDDNTGTDYGSNAAHSLLSPALMIGSHATLSWTRTGSTDVKFSGSVVVYPDGVMDMGTVASPIPRAYTALLTLDTASSKGYSIQLFSGTQYNTTVKKATITCVGESRTSGLNVSQAKLSQDHAAADTTLYVDRETGWLSGDEVVISGTEAVNQLDVKALTGDMGASSGSITALTNVHRGTSPRVARVALLTKNVTIYAVAASNISGNIAQNGGDLTLKWVYIINCGNIYLATSYVSPGTTVIDHLSLNLLALGNHNGINVGSDQAADYHVTNVSCYTGSGVSFYITTHPISTNWTAQNIWHFSTSQATQGITFSRFNSANPVTGLFVYGSGTGVYIGESAAGSPLSYTYPACSDWEACWSGAYGFSFTPSSTYFYTPNPFGLTNFNFWANATYGMYFATTPAFKHTYSTGKIFNNATCGIMFLNISNGVDIRFDDVDIANISGISRQQPYAFSTQTTSYSGIIKLLLNNVNIGAGTGFTTHTTGITYHASSATNTVWDVTQRGGAIGDNLNTLWLAVGSAADKSRFSYWRASGLGGTNVHFSANPICGTVEWDDAVYRTAAPSIMMSPLSATYKLITGDRYIPLTAAAAARTIGAYIRKDGSYNGTAPRLMLRRNDAIGVTADTVLATSALVAADTWYAVTAALPVATLDGIAEVYVDCDGTAGSIYVDDWSVT